ncbi:MAG: hypothetical protein PWR19_759 [Carnobacterium sp.]|uniref:histidine phosphatase family protein n=1 Tax=Carnobacterium sp. TaxID=48221 RepID=UPI002649D69C|nr:histidine phosphatase family protein [Carnobacterium sp.]MDN5371713.1 hypothetical protein [Carnobacterium sp.]
MRKLYIIRHGQTLFNERKLAQGWCDSPLTERGINQAKHVKSHLQDQNIQFDEVYSSTSERCCDTTELLTDLPYTRKKGLKEWNFGILEGEPEDLQRSRKPWSGTVEFSHGDYFKRFDGESDVEAQSRFNDTIHEILDEGHENTLCVAHGGVMWLYFLKRNHPNDLKGETFGNCCILEYDVKDNNEVKFARLINPAQNV